MKIYFNKKISEIPVRLQFILPIIIKRKIRQKNILKNSSLPDSEFKSLKKI